MSERIQSTQWFVDRKRKRVERAKEIVAKARDILASALADQEQQEALLADGERRLAELKIVDPPHILPVVEEFQRQQDTIVGLQQELAKLRARQSDPTMIEEDDDGAMIGLPHKKSKVGPRGQRVGEASNPGPRYFCGESQRWLMSAVTALARTSQEQGMCTSLQTLEHSSQIQWKSICASHITAR